MSLILNKPYVWVDKSRTCPVIKFLVKLENDFGLNPDAVHIEPSDTTLYLKYTIEEGYMSNFETSPVEFDMKDYPRIDRVVVEIHQDDRMLGFHVVKPIDGDFSSSGTAPYPIPYIYLQSITADYVKLYLAIYFPEEAQCYETSTVEPDSGYFQSVILKCSKKGDVPGWIYKEVELNADSSYDPVFEDIIVEVIVADDKNGTNEKKGHGTTHGSEGDASGNG